RLTLTLGLLSTLFLHSCSLMEAQGIQRAELESLTPGLSITEVTERVGEPDYVENYFPKTLFYSLQNGESAGLIFLDQRLLTAIYTVDDSNMIDWVLDPPTSFRNEYSRVLTREDLNFLYPGISYGEVFIHIGPPDSRIFAEGSEDLLIY